MSSGSVNDEETDHEQTSSSQPTLAGSGSHDCLFVGDLARFCTEEDLYETFSHFGKVVEVVIKKSKKDRTSLGYGFVWLASEEQAERAMDRLNGVALCGRPMRIRWGVRKTAESEAERSNANETINSIYVRFQSLKAGITVTEKKLVDVFSRFQNVVDANVKSSTFNKVLGTHSGYAFVHFAKSPEGVQSAFQSVKSLRNDVYDNILFQCEPSKNLVKLYNESRLSYDDDLASSFDAMSIQSSMVSDPRMVYYSPPMHVMPQPTAYPYARPDLGMMNDMHYIDPMQPRSYYPGSGGYVMPKMEMDPRAALYHQQVGSAYVYQFAHSPMYSTPTQPPMYVPRSYGGREDNRIPSPTTYPSYRQPSHRVSPSSKEKGCDNRVQAAMPLGSTQTAGSAAR